MNSRKRAARTDLLLLRLWIDDPAESEGTVALHGKVQRVVSGESYQFSDWPALLDLLARLAAQRPASAAPAPQSET